MKAYELACSADGAQPYPDDDATFRRTLQGFALKRARAGRSHIASEGYVFCVIKHQRLSGRPALPPFQLELLKEALRRIATQYPATVVRAEPFGSDELEAVGDYLQRFIDRGERYACQIAAVLAIAVLGKLRPGEVMKLEWHQLGLSRCRKFLTVWLPKRKANKVLVSGADLLVLPSAGGACDPLAAARTHAQALGHAPPRLLSKPSCSGGRVFTPLHSNGSPARGDPRRWLTQQLRRLCRLAHVPEPHFLFRRSAQGLRRGGHSDELAAGVERRSANAAGGWKSNAADLYDERRERHAAAASHLLATRRGKH